MFVDARHWQVNCEVACDESKCDHCIHEFHGNFQAEWQLKEEEELRGTYGSEHYTDKSSEEQTREDHSVLLVQIKAQALRATQSDGAQAAILPDVLANVARRRGQQEEERK